VVAGLLLWAPVLSPATGAAEALAFLFVTRNVQAALGNVLLWAGTPFYGLYEEAHRPWGLSASADQGIAGGIMMIEGSLVTIGTLAVLFLRLAEEGELRQRLLERGLDPRAVRRAVRYGRAEELSGAP